MDYATFCAQAHPDFSPVGWHLGHIAYTEALWLLQHSAGYPPLFREYHRIFAADRTPKAERVQLPTQAQVLDYVDAVREKVLYYLEKAPLDREERLWRFLIQHESQHSETIALVLQLQRWNKEKPLSLESRIAGLAENPSISQTTYQQNPPLQSPGSSKNLNNSPPALSSTIQISAGEFEQGNDSIEALDNERSQHRRFLPTYWIDRYPVTCGQYREFIQAGAYHNPSFWSSAGWEWLQANPVTQPLYWSDNSSYDNHPVCGVSWYEAEAYSRFVGKRLPTEAEWEKAASWNPATGKSSTYPWGEDEPKLRCNHNHIHNRTTPVDAYPKGASAYGVYDALGNVWEWTARWFDSYQGFEFYPYVGYSQTYFDNQHRVLKGGSWATRPWVLRSSFRNWYHPGVRQILAGFRCARS